MELTREEARLIVWEDHENWKTIESEIIDHGRWSVIYKGIFHHNPSGKCYSLCWSIGATESQDEQAFEYMDPEPIEVHSVEKLVKVWQTV